MQTTRAHRTGSKGHSTPTFSHTHRVFRSCSAIGQPCHHSEPQSGRSLALFRPNCCGERPTPSPVPTRPHFLILQVSSLHSTKWPLRTGMIIVSLQCLARSITILALRRRPHRFQRTSVAGDGRCCRWPQLRSIRPVTDQHAVLCTIRRPLFPDRGPFIPVLHRLLCASA